MNGDTIAWFLVERASADAPDLTGGMANIPRGTVFATREEADTAAGRASRDDQGRPNVIVAELVDRRRDAEEEST